jgi:transcription initiation factor TFIIB
MFRENLGDFIKYSKFDKGLFTTFSVKKKYKVKQNYDDYNKMKRLMDYNYKLNVQDSSSRNLNLAMKEIDRLCSLLYLPDYVKENASIIYRKALKKNLIKGRSINSFVAASVYVSCRYFKVPRSLKTISNKSLNDLSEISSSYRVLLKNSEYEPPRFNAYDYIPKISATLKLNADIANQIVIAIDNAHNKKLIAGKNPNGIAAAITYLVCKKNKLKVTQKQVAIASNASEVTLRKRLKEFRKRI